MRDGWHYQGEVQVTWQSFGHTVTVITDPDRCWSFYGVDTLASGSSWFMTRKAAALDHLMQIGFLNWEWA